jgi:formamidopyrimidine-DNA glycosylase
MWGAMLCYPVNDINLPDSFNARKCPTPLENDFDEKYFDGLFGGVKKSLSVKAFLATEQRIPGLGNGVLQDILFGARLNPKLKLEKLTDSQIKDMFDSVKTTLLNMTVNGGRDTERDLFGCSGGYKTILSNKTVNEPCRVCGDKIVREAYLGGNIYFCPTCQKYEK